MKKYFLLLFILGSSFIVYAQVRTNPQRTNPNNSRVANNTAMTTRGINILSSDSAAVFGGNEAQNVRAGNAGLPVQSIKILTFKDNKFRKVIMDVKNPYVDGSYLRFGQADLDFEKNEARFVYRLDPRATKLSITDKTDLLGTGFMGSSNTKNLLIQHDQRAYEFFYGFVSAKVNLNKTQKYLAQFEVESADFVDYVSWISKNHTEVLWSAKEWKPLLPTPNQHYFYKGNKKVSLVIEPGFYEGDYYIMLGGNFQNGSWKFLRFDLIPVN